MEKLFNFDINEGLYGALPSSETLGHELPSFNLPNWRELDNKNKTAAKGYSEELKGLKAKRLCSYLDFYARPSRQSLVIFHADKNKKLRDYRAPDGKEPVAEDKNIFFELTGRFVDMPDGRFHYVYLKDEYKFNTRDIWNRYHIRGTYPYEQVTGVFTYGFVREDLIKIQTKEFSVSKKVVEEVKNGFPVDGLDPELRKLIVENIHENGYDFRYAYENKTDIPIREYLTPTKYKPVKYAMNMTSGGTVMENPEYYNYRYEYYEYPRNGLSYLYILKPRFSYEIKKFVYPWTVDRVTAFRNNGEPGMLNRLNGLEENKVLKYTALTAGAILLGRALNG